MDFSSYYLETTKWFLELSTNLTGVLSFIISFSFAILVALLFVRLFK